MAMSPRNRRAQEMARANQPVVNEYYVYDDRVSTVGGYAVDDRRCVRMGAAQAQYFIDQGVIGVQAENELAPEAKNAHAQFRGTPHNQQPSLGAAATEPAAEPAPRGRRTKAEE